MNGFFESFSPIIQKYKMEVLLVVVTLALVLFSTMLYFKSNTKPQEPENKVLGEDAQKSSFSKVVVEISGAVVSPNVYEVTAGARLKDIVDAAGGLSKSADKTFFNRNFNLAKVVADQEKIYIPSTLEIADGLFQENTILHPEGKPASVKININAASQEELDTLPGIGTITAQNIIKNRPYKSIEELATKKVVKKNVYEEIKDNITVD